MKAIRTCFLILPVLLVPRLAMAQRNTWIATWASSPQPTATDPDEPLLNLEDQTVREHVRVSIGGAQICLRLSNEYGAAALPVGSVTVAAPSGSASVRLNSIRTVTFGGRNSIAIPPGAAVLSDP